MMKNYTFIVSSVLIILLSLSLEAQVDLVKDINPGGSDYRSTSYFGMIADVGNVLVFAADDGVNGSELWVSDGTAIGTSLLKDIREGVDGSNIHGFVKLNDSICLFVADDGSNGLELWRTNGTELGTEMVKDINPGSESGSPFLFSDQTFIVHNNIYYFNANDGVHGYELWRSDGTEAGTFLLKDIVNGGDGSPDHFVAFRDTLFFLTRDFAEVWKTDGTEEGTVDVPALDINGLFIQPPMHVVGDKILMAAEDAFDTDFGNELWSYSVDEDKFELVKDINPGESDGLRLDQVFTPFKDGLLFDGDNGNGDHGGQLWFTDGSTAGTRLIETFPRAFFVGMVSSITALGERAVFSVEHPNLGQEIYATDGTQANTLLLHDVYPGSRSGIDRFGYFFIHENLAFFTGNRGQDEGMELFSTDGTDQSLIYYGDTNEGRANAEVSDFYSWNGDLYLSARTENEGLELRKLGALEKPELDVTFVQILDCFGDEDGFINVEVSKGIPPYQYEWSEVGLDGNFVFNLSAGTYTVTVTDAAGSQTVQEITIEEYPQITAQATITDDVDGQNNGSITLDISGGVPPYTYSWGGGLTDVDSSVSGLAAGEYSVTITDDLGCQREETYTVEMVTGMEDLDIDKDIQLFPNPSNGELNIVVSEGYQVSKVEAYSASGKAMGVLEGNCISGFSINNDCPSGLLMLRITLDSGEVVFRRLVLKAN